MHWLVFLFSPEQDAPPPDGDGLEHERDLVWVVPTHVDNAPQEDHAPSILTIMV